MRMFATVFSIALLTSTGFLAAQTTAPAPAAPAATTPTAPAPTMAKPAKPAMSATDKAAMTAKSKECSTQADAKGLHGKARKKFREECKHGA